ncbi:MAG: hypothetical protein AAFP82_04145 [Bacteroidota bacterium]
MKIIKFGICIHFMICILFQIGIIGNKFNVYSQNKLIETAIKYLDGYCANRLWDNTFHMFCPPPKGSHTLYLRIKGKSAWFNPFDISEHTNSALRNFYQRVDFSLSQNLLKDLKRLDFNSVKIKHSASYYRLAYASKKIALEYAHVNDIDVTNSQLEFKIELVEITKDSNAKFTGKTGYIYLPSITL